LKIYLFAEVLCNEINIFSIKYPEKLTIVFVVFVLMRFKVLKTGTPKVSNFLEVIIFVEKVTCNFASGERRR